MTLRDKSLHVVHSQNVPRNPDGTAAAVNPSSAASSSQTHNGDLRDGAFSFTNASADPAESAPSPAHGSASVAPQQPGAILKAARERAGLSVGDLATRLRMSVRQVEAIETDHYEALPKGPFLRGFMRNYAKVVGVDVNVILALLDRTELGASTALRAATIAVPNQNIKVTGNAPRPGSKLRLGVIIGVVLLLLAATAYWWQYVRPNLATGGRPTPIAVQTALDGPAATTPVMAPAVGADGSAVASNPATAGGTEKLPPSKLAVPAAGAGPPVESAGQPSAMPATPEATPQQALTVAPGGLRVDTNAATVTALDARGQPTSQQTRADAATDTAAGAATVVPAGSSRLGFTFSGKSWVEIVDGRGRTILSKRYEAGDADEVVGRPPFSIVVGNAQVTRMAYNGKEFDLAPHTRVMVARVTVK